jgi:hypothetical protein
VLHPFSLGWHGRQSQRPLDILRHAIEPLGINEQDPPANVFELLPCRIAQLTYQRASHLLCCPAEFDSGDDAPMSEEVAAYFWLGRL